MLKRNENAVRTAKELTLEELKAQIGSVRDYDGIASPLENAETPSCLVIALKNEDRDGMLGILFEKNAEGVAAGALAVSRVTGCGSIAAVVRTEEQKKALISAAEEAGIKIDPAIVDDMADVRAFKEAIFLHPAYLAACADRITGIESGVILAEEGAEPEEYLYGSPWASVIRNRGIAYRIGNRFYTSELNDSKIMAGFHFGSGVIHPVKEGSCMVQTGIEAIHDLRKDSCGKCTFCREGLFQLEAIFEDASRGRAGSEDLLMIHELAEAMDTLNNCSFGLNAAGAARSIADNFALELEEHVLKKVCRTGNCSAYTSFVIDSTKCSGSGKCAEVCPDDCIDIKEGFTSVIDSFGCSHCGKCVDACENGAVLKVSGDKKPDQKAVRLSGAAASESRPDKPAKEKTAMDSAKINSLKRKARSMAKAAISKADTVQETAPSVQPRERGTGPVKKLETDIVIIAGGPAGLAAAVAAGENGARTILIDKANTVGGAANMGMGPLGIDTNIQKANFNNISVEYALKKHMEYTHYRVDEDLVSAYFHKSADTINWLQDMGVEFFGAFRYFKESEATWHIVKSDNGVIGPRAAGKMARILAEKAREQGTEIMLETAGVDLIKEGDKVVGATAIGSDGTEYEIRAKAVIVATGGFIGNKEMVKKEFGLTLQEDFFPFHMPGLQGDGLKMMWKAGACKFGLNIEAIYQVPDNATWGVLDGVLRQPNLLINQFGERFMDEGDMGNTTYTGNAIALQPGNYAYCIMDRGILRHYQKNGPDIVDLVHPSQVFFEFDEVAAKAVEQDYPAYAEGKTVAELAEKIGIDPEVLQMTIDEYNEMCENGLDSKFHKQRKFLHPITGKGGYICGKFYLGAYGTIGGVRINRYCEVLDENQIPIEGLYAAGTDANTIYGDSYNFTLPGNSMGFAVNTGRMAGEAAAQYIKE
ncbi:MAG: FAD-binding protein [Lachnospiraceae bacterium]|nr:FAD-binding protein [Lachnospiraceae bacterium]